MLAQLRYPNVRYESNRAALVDAGNRLMAELQTAKASLSTYESDLKSNEDACAACKF